MSSEVKKRLLDQIEDDLIQISDMGDGSTEYELVDGDLVVTYYEDRIDPTGDPIPEGRYQIEITVRKVK